MTVLDKLLFRVAQPKDKELLIKFLTDHFVKEEPTARALKMSTETVRKVYSSTIERCLKFPFSTIVTDPDGHVAACLLCSVWKRSDPVEDANFVADGVSLDLPENVVLFFDFVNKAHTNFWSVAPPHVNAVIHREIGSVAKQFTRRGIATRLVTENMTKTNLKKYDIGGVISETSSRANQILLEKCGFKCLKEMPYSEVVYSDGRQVLDVDDGTTALRLNFKAIEDYVNLPE